METFLYGECFFSGFIISICNSKELYGKKNHLPFSPAKKEELGLERESSLVCQGKLLIVASAPLQWMSVVVVTGAGTKV